MAKKGVGVSKKERKEDAEPRKITFTTEKEIAMDFALKVHRRFDRIIKASILFGSQATNTATSSSDIDIVLILDDASINWDMELVSWYREELAKMVSNAEYNRDLHINSVKLTTWWHDLLYGDPVVINILRYGEGLIDTGGFFSPLKALLLQGKIRSTPEAVYSALQRSPMHLARSRASEMGAIEGVYWAMTDASQAALITAGKMPPSPEHIPLFLKETFVDRGMLKMNHVNALRDIYLLHKSISHGETTKIRGVDIDRWHDIAETFMKEMTRIIDALLESKK
ncbi:nucleotidyltransferase domain-containing protein [Candidatus Pacearchaeota archaeon]|nr:nucleotidyltransferase domain-containing protein [Candidatus Pacearchaeota archaeon]